MIDLARDEQETTQGQPWEQMEGESILWHNRFNRYLQLGCKRTVPLTVEQEQRSFKALKGTDTALLPEKSGKKHRSQLVEVAKSKALQVPGSWKRASIRFAWIERAQAWDAYQIDQIVTEHLDSFLEGLASTIGRVNTLKSMAAHLETTFNANHARMSYTEECIFVARLQSVLKDIRDEMTTFNEAVARVIARKHYERLYMEVFPQITSETADAVLAQLEQEKIRRQEQAIQSF
jgi:hypothetical protein